MSTIKEEIRKVIREAEENIENKKKDDSLTYQEKIDIKDVELAITNLRYNYDL